MLERKINNVLVCVTGLSPQVVTETVYALATQSRARDLLPHEIHVITTREGKRRAEASLLSNDGAEGQLGRLCRDYGLEAERLRFGADHIHVIRDSSGRELDDIRTEEDNAAAADFIIGCVRRFSRRPQKCLHVSMAGGRKTMGFFAGYALSLYGRPGDQLSHVLVNSPFESHPDFFYPPPTPRSLLLPDTCESVSTAEARIRLASIPFVRLHDGLEPGLLDGELSFSDAVARAQQLLDPPELAIDLNRRRVCLQGHPTPLSDTLFIWITWFADRARRGLPAISFDEAGGNDLLRVVDWLEGSGPGRLRKAVEDAIDEVRRGERSNYFERTRSRLNRALRERSGLVGRAADRYQVHATGSRPRTAYRLRLTPEAIRIEGDS